MHWVIKVKYTKKVVSNLISSHGQSAGACVVSINLPTGDSQLMVSEVILTIEMQNKHADIGIT